MTSLQISQLQLVCCDQSQQLTVVTRLLQLSLTVATCLLQPPLTFFKTFLSFLFLLNTRFTKECLDKLIFFFEGNPFNCIPKGFLATSMDELLDVLCVHARLQVNKFQLYVALIMDKKWGRVGLVHRKFVWHRICSVGLLKNSNTSFQRRSTTKKRHKRHATIFNKKNIFFCP